MKYENTEHWYEIKKQRNSIDNNRCVICHGDAEVLHHIYYTEKYKENVITDVVSMCIKCHNRFHKVWKYNADKVKEDEQ